MKSSKLEKAFPDLKGLHYDEQYRIFERVKNEITKERGKLFYGKIVNLVCIVLAIIIVVIYYLIMPSKNQFGTFNIWLLLLFAFAVINSNRSANKRDMKILGLKIREIIKNEKNNSSS